EATVRRSTLDAGGHIAVRAKNEATIFATADATATASGGSAYGTGKVMAVNGVIATNIVLGSSLATIEDSTVGASTNVGGNLDVVSINSAKINATNRSSINSGDEAVGVSVAFNTVGWQSQNLLANTLDTLIGTNVGTEDPANSVAKITNSTIRVSGDVVVSADNAAIISASLGNESTSAASALFNATGISASGVLSGNMVSSAAHAYVGHRVDHAETDSPSTLAKGDQVRVASGDVYRYLGNDLTGP
ncbi:MAG: hypothetical protein GY904_14055, partial [Planctomycetaceae bacterium]|nr:hypothetical protein [Planctomycetaceae bacterium]